MHVLLIYKKKKDIRWLILELKYLINLIISH